MNLAIEQRAKEISSMLARADEIYIRITTIFPAATPQASLMMYAYIAALLERIVEDGAGRDYQLAADPNYNTALRLGIQTMMANMKAGKE